MSTPLSKFYAALEAHDWFYAMSDDHRVWSEGNAAERHLEYTAAMLGSDAQRLMRDYSAHVFSGEAFGKPKAPKPKLEDYICSHDWESIAGHAARYRCRHCGNYMIS